jgi:hypothetical protein
MTTRIVNLPKHDAILIGRDLNKLFDGGAVYEVKKFFNEFVITKIGYSALSDFNGDYPNVNSDVSEIIKDGKVFLTTTEIQNLSNKSKTS